MESDNGVALNDSERVKVAISFGYVRNVISQLVLEKANLIDDEGELAAKIEQTCREAIQESVDNFDLFGQLRATIHQQVEENLAYALKRAVVRSTWSASLRRGIREAALAIERDITGLILAEAARAKAKTRRQRKARGA